MKQKWKVLMSLFIAFVLAIPLAPMTKAGTVQAASDLIYERTPTLQCPISKVEYIPDSDGNYQIKVTLDISIYKENNLPSWDYVDVANLTLYSTDDSQWISYTQLGGVDLTEGSATFNNACRNRNLKPNENFRLYVDLGCSIDNQGDYGTTLKNDLGQLMNWMAIELTAPAIQEESEEVITPDADFVVNNQTIDGYRYKDTGSEIIYEKSFKADSTKYLEGMGWQYSGDSQDSNCRSVVYDSKGNEVSCTKADSGYYIWNFTKADTYTFKLISGNTTALGKINYKVYLKFGSVHVYTNKYLDVKAEAYDRYEDNLSYATEYVVKITTGQYDGKDTPEMIVYRENLKAGTFSNPPSLSTLDYIDYNVVFGGQYKYYIVNKNLLSSTVLADLPTSKTEKKITATTKAELTKYSAVTSAVTIPAPPVPAVIKLKNTEGVCQANLSWDIEGSNLAFVTGYKIERMTSANVVKETTNVKAEHYIEKTIYIPYKGTSNVRVTPYYTDNGKNYYGASQTIACTSAKIKAPYSYATKLSGSKARLTVKMQQGATGVEVYQRVGKKWKKIKSSTKDVYKVTWKKNKAGTSKYRFRAYIKDAGKKYYSSYGKTVKPGKNERKYSISSKPSSFKAFSQHWIPTKIYYSGNKVMVTGKFINTHIYQLKNIKVKVTFKCDGKKIGTKTISSGKISGETSKSHKAVMFRNKAGYDLRNGDLEWSYQVISWN